MKEKTLFEPLSQYRAPEMTFTEVSVEQGFAQSTELDAPDYGEGVTGF